MNKLVILHWQFLMMSYSLKHSTACVDKMIREQLGGLGTVQKIVIILLSVTALLIPFWWRIAQFPLGAALVLGLFSAIKGRKVIRLYKTSIVFFCAMCAFPLIYAVSLIYSDNVTDGVVETTHKLFFLAFGAVFLISDWSWLNKNHIHVFLQIFALSILLRFIIMVGIGTYKLCAGQVVWTDMVGFAFDPRHHCYLSLYILFAIAYVLYLLFRFYRKRNIARMDDYFKNYFPSSN